MSVVRRRNPQNRDEKGWSLFLTTDESPDSPRDAVTIGMAWRSDKDAAVIEILKAATAIAGQRHEVFVYVDEIESLSAGRVERAGLSLTDAMPTGVADILTITQTTV